MRFDYFYASEAEQFTFYRIPKVLITDSRFSNLSSDAKLLYGLMLDRNALSLKNKWMDEQNRVYIIYRTAEIMEDLNCGNQKVSKMMAELDKAGLIVRKRLGQGRPSRIYVMNFASGLGIQKCDNHISKDVNTTFPEVRKSHVYNKTDYSDTNESDQACTPVPHSRPSECRESTSGRITGNKQKKGRKQSKTAFDNYSSAREEPDYDELERIMIRQSMNL